MEGARWAAEYARATFYSLRNAAYVISSVYEHWSDWMVVAALPPLTMIFLHVLTDKLLYQHYKEELTLEEHMSSVWFTNHLAYILLGMYKVPMIVYLRTGPTLDFGQEWTFMGITVVTFTLHNLYDRYKNHTRDWAMEMGEWLAILFCAADWYGSDVYGFAHQLMLVVSVFQWIRCILAVAKWMGKLEEETRVQYVRYAELGMMVAPAFLASKPETYHLFYVLLLPIVYWIGDRRARPPVRHEPLPVFALLKYTGTQLQLGAGAPVARIEDHPQADGLPPSASPSPIPVPLPIPLPDLAQPNSQAAVGLPELETVPVRTQAQVPTTHVSPTHSVPHVAPTQSPDLLSSPSDARARLPSITEEKEIDLISFDLL